MLKTVSVKLSDSFIYSANLMSSLVLFALIASKKTFPFSGDSSGRVRSWTLFHVLLKLCLRQQFDLLHQDSHLAQLQSSLTHAYIWTNTAS